MTGLPSTHGPRGTGHAEASMPQRQFANQKALIAYAKQNVLVYEYVRQREQ